MIPIKDFELSANPFPRKEALYANVRDESHPMHKKMLLLEMQSVFKRQFAVGYYDAVMDVFCVCMSPFLNILGNKPYKELFISKIGAYIAMPYEFIRYVGPKCITGFMPIEDAIFEIESRNLNVMDIDPMVEESLYHTPYLVYTNDNRIVITEVSCFCDHGKQFCINSPQNINGNIYHMSSMLPRNMVRYAVDLTKLEYQPEKTKSRMVDADVLLEELKKNDLSFMQQADIIECIKDTIERQCKNGGNA